MKNFILYNYEFERIHHTQLNLFDAEHERINPEEAFKNKNMIFAKSLMDDYEQTKLDKRVRDKSKLIEGLILFSCPFAITVKSKSPLLIL